MGEVAKYLCDFEPGDTVQVHTVIGEGAVPKRLMELGLVEGTIVRIVKRAPLGEPIEIKFRGSHLALRLDEAANVSVERMDN